MGVGWNIQNERFLRDSKFFQLLKLRASVGNPGNQNFAAYQAFSTYAFNGWMTNIFGTGVDADLYTASYNSTLYLFTTMCYALCIAAVPILTKEFAADRKRGEKAANNLMTITLLGSLAARYPFLSFSSIGKSVLGKDLVSLRLGRGEKRVPSSFVRFVFFGAAACRSRRKTCG